MTTLAAIDFSEASRTAMCAAARLADRRDTDLVLLHCLEEASDLPLWEEILELGKTEERLLEDARDRLERLWQQAAPDGSPTDVSLWAESTPPGRGIVEVAEHLEANRIVVGATGRNRVTEALFGSTAEAVVRRSDVPVLVLPEEGPIGPYEHVLAPVDLSDCSEASLELAASIARRDSATLEILHAYNIPAIDPGFFSPMMTPDRIEAFEIQRWEMFESFVDDFELADLDCDKTLEAGMAQEVIADLARSEPVDLVVMGTHGRSGFERFFLGSTTTRVLRRMPAPILTLRTREESN